MRLEDQVASLELSKRLKELGVEQRGIFWWNSDGELVCRAEQFDNDVCVPYTSYAKREKIKDSFAAFTVAELGEMLPEKVKEHNKTWGLRFKKVRENGYVCRYVSKHSKLKSAREGRYGILHNSPIESESDSRAHMLIYLLENGLLVDNPVE